METTKVASPEEPGQPPQSTSSAIAIAIDAGRDCSLLFPSLTDPGMADLRDGPAPTVEAFACDLNLDQIIQGIADEREEEALITAVLYRQLHDVAVIEHRQEVFADLEDEPLLERLKGCAELLRRVRTSLRQLPDMRSRHQQEGWLLSAIDVYCKAVRSLEEGLEGAPITSRGLVGFRAFIHTYATSSVFRTLEAETAVCQRALERVQYCVRIRGGHVEVSRYEGEEDYSAEVLQVFERFKQGAVKDYLVPYRGWPGMNHVAAQILDLVARLFSDEFSVLGDYYSRHRDFLDPTVRQFDRELQLYLAYLDFIAPLRAAGLSFCRPEVGPSKEIWATDMFDVALARKLVSEGTPVVTNNLRLSGSERIFVVSGPNQGGKTTFARTVGQLHHLASVGCPVPGSGARLLLFDHLFTHFEREEDLTRMRGKLEDDLERIREVLLAATGDSILIMNEVFSSTTLNDSRFLGRKVLEKVIELDSLAVYITFIDELASLDPSIVSMVSTIVPEDPAERTFKVVRGPADGLAYAWAIAEKHGLTYERLRRRILQ